MSDRQVIVFPRTLLLIEIERRCSFADCGARTFIGLTKQQTFRYRGFECARCGRWQNDRLEEKDVPEWWAEIQADRVN